MENELKKYEELWSKSCISGGGITTKGVKSSSWEAKKKKKKVDTRMDCDPPKGHHTKTDMQFICGINISWYCKLTIIQ